jgi:hypothetical protein
MDQEVKEAREKLAARFGNTQIGGKGKSIMQLRSNSLLSGTQRRKKKHVNVQNINEDKKLKSAIKKFGTFKPHILHYKRRTSNSHNPFAYRSSATFRH